MSRAVFIKQSRVTGHDVPTCALELHYPLRGRGKKERKGPHTYLKSCNLEMNTSLPLTFHGANTTNSTYGWEHSFLYEKRFPSNVSMLWPGEHKFWWTANPLCYNVANNIRLYRCCFICLRFKCQRCMCFTKCYNYLYIFFHVWEILKYDHNDLLLGNVAY